MPYSIRFDFDCKGEPPKVIIVDDNDGCDCIEVLEEPTMPDGGKLVEVQSGVWDWQGLWSWEAEDWEPGPLAKQVLTLLNSRTALGGEQQ